MREPGPDMTERASFARLEHDREGLIVTVAGLRSGAAATAGALAAVGAAGVPVDMLTMVPSGTGVTELRFVVARTDRPAVLTALAGARGQLGATPVRCDEDVARLTLHGAGLRADATVVPTFQEALLRAGVRTLTMSNSDQRITAMCPLASLPRAVGALREAFECPVDPPVPALTSTKFR
ncbi:MAG TPA: hypothetical protein VFC00_38605 [Micromonosporaceae bacterium]|nr:hypothetical protein [Micromonosporaceae bacterium]